MPQIIRAMPFRKKTLLAMSVVFAGIGLYLILRLFALAPVASSVKSGNWSDPTVWSTGQVPSSTSPVVISAGNSVTYDLATSKVDSVDIKASATLQFSSASSTTLESNGNVVVEGNLVMKPANAATVQILRFVASDETKFVGGGMTPLSTDDGLWVIGAGKLDISGSAKSGWLRAVNSLSSLTTTISLESSPVGWKAGDEVAVAPTADSDSTNFEVRKIASVNGSSVVLTSGLSIPHPTNKLPNGVTYGAEVMNLTRNVQIEGMPPSCETCSSNPGRAHIWINSSLPQNVNYAAIRYMGPRKAGSDGSSELVLGRYGLHFHLSGEGSRGSQVIGSVVRDTGSHAFVAHMSNGVTFRDTISFNTYEEAYWWDDNTATNDTLYDHAAAALVKTDPPFRGYRLNGFELKEGVGNTIKNSVGIGIQGNKTSAAFLWPEADSGVWTFSNNVAHNNSVDGIFVWQNNPMSHDIADLDSYNNPGNCIEHGAYTNVYHFSNISCLGSGILIDAASKLTDTGRVIEYDNVTVKGAPFGLSLVKHTLPAGSTAILSNWTVDATTPVIADENAGAGTNNPSSAGLFDLVCWKIGSSGRDLESGDIKVVSMADGSVIRVQRKDGAAFKVTNAGVTIIPKFSSCSTGSSGDTTKPSAPTNLHTTTVSDTQIILAWNASTDNVGVTGYDVYRNSNVVATVTSPNYQDNGLTPSTTYSYFVKAKDAANNASDPSNNLSVTTLPSQAPPPDSTPPTVSLTAPTAGQNITNSPFNVTANANDNNGGSGVSRVDFLVDGTVKASDTTSPYGFSWAANQSSNGLHTVAAKAYDVTGNPSTTSSANVNVQIGDITKPTAPTNLAAHAVSPSQINLSWTASTDNVGVTGYWIVKNGVTIASSPTNSFSNTGLLPSTTYSYQVIAFDAAGNNSNASNTAQATTQAQSDNQPPTAPTQLVASPVSATQINLAWHASTDNVGVIAYDVYRGSSKIASVTTTSFGDSGLTPTTTYNYFVKARDSAGNVSQASATVSATTQSSSQTGRQVSFKSASTKSNSSPDLGVVIPKPTGIASSNLLLAVVSARGNAVITAPTGWSKVREDINGNVMRTAIFYHVAGSSEPNNYTFALSNKQTAAGSILAYSDANTASPIGVTSGVVTTTQSNRIVASSVSTTSNTLYAVGFFSSALNNAINPPASMTERSDVASPGTFPVSLETSDLLMTSPGYTGNKTATTAQAAANIGQLISLRSL